MHNRAAQYVERRKKFVKLTSIRSSNDTHTYILYSSSYSVRNKERGIKRLLTTYEQNLFSYFFDAASAIRFESVTKP